MTQNVVIKFRNVSKRFGAVEAVTNVTFEVRSGETISLLGPSGCGKTTTLRLISGFEEPDTGVIEIEGENMAHKRPYERNVGLLFQDYALFPHMTVAENLAFGLKHRRWPKSHVGPRVAEMLSLVKLEGLENRHPAQLSGGQQQRVALARVLATRPKLVLLDEPLSALDAKLREDLRVELKHILAAVGSTTIVVTHDQEEAMSLADRIIVMNQGRVEQHGTPDDIYIRPQTHFVASFVGRSNWFHRCRPDGGRGGMCRLVTRGGTLLWIPSTDSMPVEECCVCVRPERLTVARTGAGDNRPNENRLEGRLVDVVSMGAERHLHVETSEGRITVVEPNRGSELNAPGYAVSIRFRPKDCTALPPDCA